MRRDLNLQRLAQEAGDDVDAYLQEPTDHACRHCGQMFLRRFEVLNDDTCESCRVKYLATLPAYRPGPAP